jgi:septal ring factor EnvC (AmiA/AmiB activator)
VEEDAKKKQPAADFQHKIEEEEQQTLIIVRWRNIITERETFILNAERETNRDDAGVMQRACICLLHAWKERAGNERLASLNQSLPNDLLALYLDIHEMDRHHDQKENELHQMRKALSASSKECRKLKNMLERTTSFVNCKNAEHAARTSDLRRRIKKRKDSSTGSVIEAQEKEEVEEPYLANKKNVTNAVIKTSKHMDVASGMVVNGT